MFIPEVNRLKTFARDWWLSTLIPKNRLCLSLPIPGPVLPAAPPSKEDLIKSFATTIVAMATTIILKQKLPIITMSGISTMRFCETVEYWKAFYPQQKKQLSQQEKNCSPSVSNSNTSRRPIQPVKKRPIHTVMITDTFPSKTIGISL